MVQGEICNLPSIIEEMVNIKVFYFNAYRECTYVVSNCDKHAIIIDAGMSDEREHQRLNDYLKKEDLKPVALLITHTHPDHICGMKETEMQYQLQAIIQPNEGKLEIPNFSIEVIATPGHKEDAVCYYLPEEDILFTGDTLFQESIGRTDLPGGDMSALIRSLHKLILLPEKTTVYPGHGYATTIGHEKLYNPYL